LSSQEVVVAQQPGHGKELLVDQNLHNLVIRATHLALLQVLLVGAEILQLLIVERVEGQLFVAIGVPFLDETTKPPLLCDKEGS